MSEKAIDAGVGRFDRVILMGHFNGSRDNPARVSGPTIPSTLVKRKNL